MNKMTNSAFQEIKHALMQAPALRPPDLTKLFFYMSEKGKIALGILTQRLGPELCTVALFAGS